MPLFNVRISGQIEAKSASAAKKALADHLVDEAAASPLLVGGILRFEAEPIAAAKAKKRKA